MAHSTGIRGLCFDAQIGAGYTETMVATGVNLHVGCRRHMTVNTLAARGINGVTMMFGGVELLATVALRTGLIAS